MDHLLTAFYGALACTCRGPRYGLVLAGEFARLSRVRLRGEYRDRRQRLSPLSALRDAATPTSEGLRR